MESAAEDTLDDATGGERCLHEPQGTGEPIIGAGETEEPAMAGLGTHAKSSQLAQQLNTPAHWPPEVRAATGKTRITWLPPDWGKGTKVTNNGTIVRVFISPEGKVYYNKTGIEKHIGRELEPLPSVPVDNQDEKMINEEADKESAKKRIKAEAASELASRVVVKPGPGLGKHCASKPSFPSSPRAHHKLQVAVVDRMVPHPWQVCFGGLGSGILGVRPVGDTSSTSPTSRRSDLCGEELPPDATVLLFMNPPANKSHLQSRNGRTMGGHVDGVDSAKRTLSWSTQRHDKTSKKIMTFVRHQRAGGRVLVVVRGDQHFSPLGAVSSIDNVELSSCRVREGDLLLAERGTRCLHKGITAHCMNDNLRCGVGLQAVRFPPKGPCHLCKACCYRPGSCTLHFDTLEEEGLAAFFHQRLGRPGPPPAGAKAEGRVKGDEAVVRPEKRLRGKQAVTKAELADDAPPLPGSGAGPPPDPGPPLPGAPPGAASAAAAPAGMPLAGGAASGRLLNRNRPSARC